MKGAMLFMGILAAMAAVTSSKSYHIELIVVVEHSAYIKWMQFVNNDVNELKKEMEGTIMSAGDSIRSLNHYHLDVDLRVKEIIYDVPNIASKTSTTNANINTALKNLEDYLQAHGKTYDHATLLTDLDMGWSYWGGAREKTMCKTNGVSAIRMFGTHTTSELLAHEIGHTMGSGHDSTEQCKGYVMSPSVRPRAEHRGEFSYCSYVAIYHHIQTLHCLDDTNLPEMNYKRLGELITEDDVCHRGVDINAHSVAKYSNIVPKECLYLVCETSNSYRYYFQTDGSKCSNGGRCLIGKCQRNLAAPPVLPPPPPPPSCDNQHEPHQQVVDGPFF